MGDVYRVVGPPPLIFLLGLGLGITGDVVLSDSDLPAGVAIAVGVVLVVIGVALLWRFEASFRRAETAILPGREASALVTAGIYGWTRNPGYLGMTITAAGIAFLADAPWALLGVAPAVLVVDRGVIVHEERYLASRFGDEYDAYRARVRRWV